MTFGLRQAEAPTQQRQDIARCSLCSIKAITFCPHQAAILRLLKDNSGSAYKPSRENCANFLRDFHTIFSKFLQLIEKCAFQKLLIKKSVEFFSKFE